VNAATVNDVVVAVQFAANHGLKVSARGTGHQLSGIAIPANGVLVNMASLNAISADVAARTATVQVRINPDLKGSSAHLYLSPVKRLQSAQRRTAETRPPFLCCISLVSRQLCWRLSSELRTAACAPECDVPRPMRVTSASAEH